MTSLLDKWRFYMKDVKSPDLYIDMGFYFLISAALQRRVWTGTTSPELRPLFPNLYIVFVGPPAVGKGLVLKQIAKILRYHNWEDTRPQSNLVKQNRAAFGLSPSRPEEEKLLFPMAPDATTYESLLHSMTKAFRPISYSKLNEKGETINALYVHRSLCFCLDELSSLFKRNQISITKFLLNAFDCEDYEYETKHQGEDRIKKLCLGLLAGTTPTFIEESFDERLLADGLTSRMIFVFESMPRFVKYDMPDISTEQLEARVAIINHIKKLSTLFGHITFSKTETPEAFEVFRAYFEEVLPRVRVNNSMKLESYYGRKDIHVLKLAMAIHFSRSFDLVLTPEDCRDALNLLNTVEKKMHMALEFGSNPLFGPSKNILQFLRRVKDPQTPKQLFIEFSGDVRETEMMEILRMLEMQQKVKVVPNGTGLAYVANDSHWARSTIEQT